MEQCSGKPIIKDPVRLLLNRPIVAITLVYIGGILAGRVWIGNSDYYYGLAVLFLLLITILYRYKYLDLFLAVLFLAVAFAGGAAYYFTLQPSADELTAFTGVPVYLEGTIAEEPQFYEDHDSYQVTVDIVENAGGRFKVAGVILVKIYGENLERYWFGERIRIRSSIIEPRGLRNPGGFDYRFHLKSRGIDALIYPKTNQVESLGQGNLNEITRKALEFRTGMVEIIEKTLPSPSGDLLIAMLYGQRERLPEDVEENFRRAGVGHLMAVSGLHVGLVAAFALGLLRLVGLRSRLALIPVIMIVISYAYLTGMRPSAIRAALMVSVALGATLFDREHDIPSAVSFAALVTIFFNPLLLFTLGFQLSYAATITLIYAYKPLLELIKLLPCPHLLQKPLAVTMAAQIGVLPLSIYYFHTIPTGALIFNLILMPLLAFVLGLGLSGAIIALFIPAIGELLIWASRPLLEIMLYVTSFSRFPFLYLTVHPPGILEILFSATIIIICLWLYHSWADYIDQGGKVSFLQYVKSNILILLPVERFSSKHLVTVILLTAVVITWSGYTYTGSVPLKVTFIDVGQGASALIESPCGTVILIDAGGESDYRGNPGIVGERVVAPLFRHLGIKKVDLAIITHPHEDHFGGFIPLIDHLSIDQLIISPAKGESEYYRDLLDKAQNNGVVVNQALSGQVWSCRCGLILEIISPPELLYTGTNSDLNNNSVVVMLKHDEVQILFPGDIEETAVRGLINAGYDLTANLLLVPHHGGYFESAPVFFEEVNPEYAVIQVGSNSFGHPHPYVLDALYNAGIKVLRNDYHGAVIVKSDGSKLDVVITADNLVLE